MQRERGLSLVASEGGDLRLAASALAAAEAPGGAGRGDAELPMRNHEEDLARGLLK